MLGTPKLPSPICLASNPQTYHPPLPSPPPHASPRAKRLHIHFLRSPVEVVGQEGRAAEVVLEKTRLEAAGEGRDQRAIGTGAAAAGAGRSARVVRGFPCCLQLQWLCGVAAPGDPTRHHKHASILAPAAPTSCGAGEMELIPAFPPLIFAVQAKWSASPRTWCSSPLDLSQWGWMAWPLTHAPASSPTRRARCVLNERTPE